MDNFKLTNLLNLLTPSNKKLVNQGIGAIARQPSMEVQTNEGNSAYRTPDFTPQRTDNTPIAPPFEIEGAGTTSSPYFPNQDNVLDASTRPRIAPDISTRPRVSGIPNDQPITPPVANSPIDIQRQKVQGIRDAGVNPGSEVDASGKVIKKKGAPWWKDLLSYGASGLAVASGDKNVRVQGWNAAKYDKKIRQEEGKLAQMQREALQQQASDLRQAQIENIPFDNETQRLRIEEQKANRDARERIATDRQRSGALKQLNRLKYYDPNNNAHQELATRAGMDVADLEGWDDRNPVEKKVAGIVYRLDRKTGEYKPTNLEDTSEKLVDYDVIMANGEKRTYKVSVKDAARFSTQMSAMNARLKENRKIRKENRQLTMIKTRTQLLKTAESVRSQAIARAIKNGDSEEQANAKGDAEKQRFLASQPKELR